MYIANRIATLDAIIPLVKDRQLSISRYIHNVAQDTRDRRVVVVP